MNIEIGDVDVIRGAAAALVTQFIEGGDEIGFGPSWRVIIFLFELVPQVGELDFQAGHGMASRADEVVNTVGSRRQGDGHSNRFVTENRVLGGLRPDITTTIDLQNKVFRVVGITRLLLVSELAYPTFPFSILYYFFYFMFKREILTH